VCPQTVFSFPLWADYTGDGRIDILNGIRILDAPELDFSASYENDGGHWLRNGGYADPPEPPIVAKNECLNSTSWVRGRSVLADVNGDGRADLLYHGAPSSAACWQIGIPSYWTERRVYLNTGSGWQSTPDAEWSAALGAMLDGFGAYLDDVVFVDLNGDGLVDGLGLNDDGATDGTAVRLNTARAGWRIRFSVQLNPRPVDLTAMGSSIMLH
jgi:hypothetical protein